MFNLQSGIHRQRYPAPLTPSQAKKVKLQSLGVVDEDPKQKFWYGHEKHTKAVTGIAIDGVNRTVVSCGLDGKLKVSSCSRYQRPFTNVVSSGTFSPDA